MPKDDVTRRRHVLLVDVTQAASEVSRLVHEARDLNLPVEPGVRTGETRSSAGPLFLRRCCHDRTARPYRPGTGRRPGRGE
jgi:hypothetical protein